MTAILAGIQAATLWICAIGLLALACVGLASLVGHMLRAARRNLPPGTTVVIVIGTIIGVIYGGSKGRVTVDDPYITDNGSYVTNDYIHVSIAKRTTILPDTTEILVYYRPIDSTNAEDWVEFTPRLTFADFPHDFPLAYATNYNALVGASYTPEPTVHTNGVWQIKGFLIPGAGGKASFVHTRIRLFDEPDTNDVLTVEETP